MEEETKKNIVNVRYTFWIGPRTQIKILPKRNRLDIIFPDHMGKIILIFKQKDFTLKDFLDNLLKVIAEYNLKEGESKRLN